MMEHLKKVYSSSLRMCVVGVIYPGTTLSYKVTINKPTMPITDAIPLCKILSFSLSTK